MLLLVGIMLPALAVSSGKEITVYPGVNIYIDDKKINPTDSDGKPIEAFIYDGSSYLPIEAVSKSLGKPIYWDGSTSSVYIGKHSSDKPTAWLSDMDYFDGDGLSWYTNQTVKDNWGSEHTHTIKTSFENYNKYRIYVLNGQYSALSGTLFQTYEARTKKEVCNVAIYGDDKLLWKADMSSGIDPKDFYLNTTGVLKLKIEFSGYSHTGCVALGEVGLWQ